MNLISGWMKIAKRANKPPALVTARTKRMTADHSRRKRRGFFFGGAANCTLLDDTSNTGIALFLSATIISTCDGFARHDNGLTGGESARQAGRGQAIASTMLTPASTCEARP